MSRYVIISIFLSPTFIQSKFSLNAYLFDLAKLPMHLAPYMYQLPINNFSNKVSFLIYIFPSTYEVLLNHFVSSIYNFMLPNITIWCISNFHFCF